MRSVPGLEAKPVIDIIPVVNDIKLVDEYNHFMQEIGYEPKGENGITGRWFFQKGGDNRTHHVHTFRDYLREHAKAVQEYGQFEPTL
ncbi:GrpB family protein [Halomonas sp. ISL-60]|nr:GrpB family protein [Halomonas sp. ISL-60]